MSHISRVSCEKGPSRHAYAWQIGPFWQDTLEILSVCWQVAGKYHDGRSFDQCCETVNEENIPLINWLVVNTPPSAEKDGQPDMQ